LHQNQKLIQVNKHDGERPVVAVRKRNRMGQSVVEQFSIGKPGQRVMQGAHLCFVCILLRHAVRAAWISVRAASLRSQLVAPGLRA
jgi:hypothetical protein